MPTLRSGRRSAQRNLQGRHAFGVEAVNLDDLSFDRLALQRYMQRAQHFIISVSRIGENLSRESRCKNLLLHLGRPAKLALAGARIKDRENGDVGGGLKTRLHQTSKQYPPPLKSPISSRDI